MVKVQKHQPFCTRCRLGLFGHHYVMRPVKNQISCLCDNCNQEIFTSPSPFPSRLVTFKAVLALNKNTNYDDYLAPYLQPRLKGAIS